MAVQPTRSLRSVCVVGAGAAGLCAAHLLQSLRPALDIVVYEKTCSVGGVWEYSDKTESRNGLYLGHGRVHKNMTTNLPKEIMAFPDFPFSQDLPSFIHHSDVLDYLKKYALHFDLHKYIHFRRKVVRISPVEVGNPSTQWSIVSEDVTDQQEAGDYCGEKEVHRVEKVNQEQKFYVDKEKATFPKQSSGINLTEEDHRTQSTVQSENYCRQQNGTELVASPQGRREQIFDAVIVCTGNYYRPKTSSVPDLSAFLGKVLHSYVYRNSADYQGQCVLVVGTGPSGRDVVLDVAPGASKVYLSYNRQPFPSELPKKITQVPRIRQATSEGIELIDGRILSDVDTVILCSGYQYDYSFLDPKCAISVENGRVCQLYKHTLNIPYPSMALIGMFVQILPWPMFYHQIDWVLRVLLGIAEPLPSCDEMIKDSDLNHKALMETTATPHKLGSLQWALRDDFLKMSGLGPAATYRREIYEATRAQMKQDLTGYKNCTFVVHGDSSWTRQPF